MCATPGKWDLKGKSHETVKFDISMNGKDFAGNFDFRFTE